MKDKLCDLAARIQSLEVALREFHGQLLQAREDSDSEFSLENLGELALLDTSLTNMTREAKNLKSLIRILDELDLQSDNT